MSESNLWVYLRQKMQGRWEAERIENRLNAGVPDVAYTISHHGWLELKFLAKIPAGPVRIRHFTPEQRNWIHRHGRRSNRVFMLLQADREYLLFDHRHVFDIGELCFDDLVQVAVGHWSRTICADELVQILDR